MWNKESIHSLLDQNPRAVERALVAIWKRQTADEQANLTTKHANGVGFSAFDAEFCSDIAQRLVSGRVSQLSPKQLAVCRNKMKRYWRQLVELADQSAVRPVELVAHPAVPGKACTCELSDGEPHVQCTGACVQPVERARVRTGSSARGSW